MKHYVIFFNLPALCQIPLCLPHYSLCISIEYCSRSIFLDLRIQTQIARTLWSLLTKLNISIICWATLLRSFFSAASVKYYNSRSPCQPQVAVVSRQSHWRYLRVLPLSFPGHNDFKVWFLVGHKLIQFN